MNTPVAAKAPSKSKTGPAFVKSQDSTSVRPATDRGEASPLPVEHCEAKRKAFDTGYMGY